MTLQERINDLFNKFNVNLTTTKLPEVEVELEAQAVLENGTVIYTDAATFDEGAEVYIVNEEGEKIPLPDGDYTLEDGSTISIADGGKVTKTADGDADAVVDTQPAKGKTKKAKKSAQDKLEEGEADVEDWAGMEKRIQNLEDGVADLKRRIGEDVEIVGEPEEEMKEQSPEEAALEELKAQLSSQNDKIIKLQTQAASEGVRRVKTAERKAAPVNLKDLNHNDRVKALFNKFNQ